MQGQSYGKFIVFEGGEGAGKTTQIQRSHQWLCESGWRSRLQQQGYCSEIIITREPGGTPLGKEIRHLLLNPYSTETLQDRTELLLYAADRAQHVEGFLKPHLQQGAFILCDRYTDSTVAYQGYGRQLDLALIDQLNQLATNGLESDLTLWLDLDPEVGLQRTQKRGTSDRIEQSSLEFHHRVRSGFTALAEAHPQRIVRMDASQSEENVAQAIQVVLEERLTQWYCSSSR